MTLVAAVAVYWVLLLDGRGSGRVWQVNGYQTEQECKAAGEEFRKWKESWSYHCIPGPAKVGG
jgi:hypothetical protein